MHFSGFHSGMEDYYRELKKNNTREWYDENKERFTDLVLNPAKAFVVAMGEKLKTIAPDVHAEPKIDRSIFRHYRDTRFSNDKSPYKTHLGIWFWRGARERMECSGFYFQYSPPMISFGVGMYQFPKPVLEEYRRSVVDQKHGETLSRAVEAVRKAGFEIGGSHYKRIPSGFDKGHPNAELLKHNTLYAWHEEPAGDEIHHADFTDYALRIYQAMMPIEEWVHDLFERAARP